MEKVQNIPFRVVEIDGRKFDEVRVSSPSEGISLVKHSPKALRLLTARDTKTKWLGFAEGETVPQFLAAGFLPSILATYRKAAGKMAEDLRPGGGLRSLPSGGSWAVSRVLTGHPRPAIARDRLKLAPKTIQVAVNGHSAIRPEDMALPAAIVARSAREYSLRGGSVSLTLRQIAKYSDTSPRGTIGCVVYTSIPIANESAVALGLSSVYFRTVALRIMQALSPNPNDWLPLYRGPGSLPPGTIGLSGELHENLKALKAAGFEIPEGAPHA